MPNFSAADAQFRFRLLVDQSEDEAPQQFKCALQEDIMRLMLGPSGNQSVSDLEWFRDAK
jgi:hypothetical protein